MEIMLKNKNGFQVNISLSIFFIAFCDLFTDFPTYLTVYHPVLKFKCASSGYLMLYPEGSCWTQLCLYNPYFVGNPQFDSISSYYSNI
jgi:hypothetical protein